MNEKKINVRGAVIRYSEGGAEGDAACEGAPLLLLPSSAGRATEYQEIVPLLEKSFHVYSVDYPGFGQSDPLPSMEGVDDLAAFVLDWLNAVEIQRCHLAGFSMGGWVGLSLALSHPERILKLILIATSGGRLPGVPILNPSGLTYKETLDRFYHRPEIKAKLARQKLTPPEKEEILRSSRALARLVSYQKVIPEFHHRLREIRIPTLIIGADHDRAIPLPFQERLHAEIEKSKLVIFQETGHAVVAERPQELSEEIQKFILSRE